MFYPYRGKAREQDACWFTCKNLALIEQADVEFGNGLNILTGETGAGKSIIIGSVAWRWRKSFKRYDKTRRRIRVY